MPTSPTPIDALPDYPSISDPDNFETEADAYLGAFPTFRTQTNALATNVYNNAVEANADAVATAADAVSTAADVIAAAASAAQALADPATNATSTTSFAVQLYPTGSLLSLTLAQTGKEFVVGQDIIIAYDTDPTIKLYGTIVTFNSGTGAMTVNVDAFNGSGTYAVWTISRTVRNAIGGEVEITGNTTIGGDLGRVYRVTASCTVTVANTRPEGWRATILAADGVTVTFDFGTNTLTGLPGGDTGVLIGRNAITLLASAASTLEVW